MHTAPLRFIIFLIQDVAIMCVSFRHSSVLSVIDDERFWRQEVKNVAPKVPIVIVETKQDIQGPQRFGYSNKMDLEESWKTLCLWLDYGARHGRARRENVFERTVQFVIEEEKNKVIQFF